MRDCRPAVYPPDPGPHPAPREPHACGSVISTFGLTRANTSVLTGRVAAPQVIPPMLATPGDVPTGPGWGYEFKWDGVRGIALVQDAGVRVFSRNDRDVTPSYPELGEIVQLLHGREA